MDEIENTMSSGIGSRDKTGPCDRTFRRDGGSQMPISSLLHEPQKMRQFTPGRHPFQDLRVHGINAENQQLFPASWLGITSRPAAGKTDQSDDYGQKREKSEFAANHKLLILPFAEYRFTIQTQDNTLQLPKDPLAISISRRMSKVYCPKSKMQGQPSHRYLNCLTYSRNFTAARSRFSSEPPPSRTSQSS